MDIHIFLRDKDTANNFLPHHFEPLTRAFPEITPVFHQRRDSLREALPEAELIDTWFFDQEWFEQAPKLRHVFTPAAGRDWVHQDPTGRVSTWYGRFHGPMIAESMLGMIFHFTREMNAMLELQRQHIWDRNRQENTRLLGRQTVLILGYGNIGRTCARYLRTMGCRVLAHQRAHRQGTDPETGAEFIHDDALMDALPLADHVVMLLPGSKENYGFMTRQKLAVMKQGACIYNFGRGTTLLEADLLWALDEGPVAAAGIDVTEKEPLGTDSGLWDHPAVVLHPHSSCVFQEYQILHVEELIEYLRKARIFADSSQE
ncbi:MAG: hypothetical protein KDI36_16400 [Pseudomonadales bacterium]|nr:hypothetical protein [Pseudomonadales bacterium]